MKAATFYAKKTSRESGHHIEFEHLAQYKAYLSGIKDDTQLEIRIKKYIQKRSNPQNRYYWKIVVNMVADHCGMTPQEAHEGLKWMFLKERGEYMPTVKSTAKLTTKEFVDYIEQCVIWAAQFLSVVIPDPTYPDEH